MKLSPVEIAKSTGLTEERVTEILAVIRERSFRLALKILTGCPTPNGDKAISEEEAIETIARLKMVRSDRLDETSRACLMDTEQTVKLEPTNQTIQVKWRGLPDHKGAAERDPHRFPDTDDLDAQAFWLNARKDHELTRKAFWKRLDRRTAQRLRKKIRDYRAVQQAIATTAFSEDAPRAKALAPERKDTVEATLQAAKALDTFLARAKLPKSKTPRPVFIWTGKPMSKPDSD